MLIAGFKTSGFKTSGFKTSGLQKCSVAKKTSIYSIFCTCGWWKSAGFVAVMFFTLCFILDFRVFFAIHDHR
jgi:hypothetical protein